MIRYPRRGGGEGIPGGSVDQMHIWHFKGNCRKLLCNGRRLVDRLLCRLGGQVADNVGRNVKAGYACR